MAAASSEMALTTICSVRLGYVPSSWMSLPCAAKRLNTVTRYDWTRQHRRIYMRAGISAPARDTAATMGPWIVTGSEHMGFPCIHSAASSGRSASSATSCKFLREGKPPSLPVAGMV